MKKNFFWGACICTMLVLFSIGVISRNAMAADGITIGKGNTVTRTISPAKVTYTLTLTGATNGTKLLGKSPWITYVKNGTQKYTVTIDSNAYGSTRIGSIAFYDSAINKKWELKITQYSFNVSASKLTYTAAASSKGVTLNYDGYCSGVNDSSWITVTKNAAKSFTVSVKMNPYSYKRTGTITFLYGGAKRVITIEQTANSLYLSGYNGEKRSGYGYSNSFTMTATTPSGVISSVSSSNSSWLKVSKNGLKVTVTCTQNTGAERSGTITVTSGNVSQQIRVTQKNLMATIAEAEYNTYAGKAYNGEKYKNWIKTTPGNEWVNSNTLWCACFASWCANQAGYISAGSMIANPTSLEIVNWLNDKNRKRYIERSDASSNNIKAGMLVFFDRTRDDADGEPGTRDDAGIADHVGVVVEVNGRSITVVEGNMTGNGGRCIQRNIYDIQKSTILGYGNIIP